MLGWVLGVPRMEFGPNNATSKEPTVIAVLSKFSLITSFPEIVRYGRCEKRLVG